MTTAFYLCCSVRKRFVLVLLTSLSLAAKAYAADFPQCAARVREAIKDGTVER